MSARLCSSSRFENHIARALLSLVWLGVGCASDPPPYAPGTPESFGSDPHHTYDDDDESYENWSWGVKTPLTNLGDTASISTVAVSEPPKVTIFERELKEYYSGRTVEAGYTEIRFEPPAGSEQELTFVVGINGGLRRGVIPSHDQRTYTPDWWCPFFYYAHDPDEGLIQVARMTPTGLYQLAASVIATVYRSSGGLGLEVNATFDAWNSFPSTTVDSTASVVNDTSEVPF